MEAQIKINDGFSKEDLRQPAYANRLAEICAIIHTHNISLIRRACSRDFDPAKELDRSGNGAASYLYDLVMAIALYEEGRVPWQVAKLMCESTAELLRLLQNQSQAPFMEIETVGLAFRLLWDMAGRCYPKPNCSRGEYEKNLFELARQINDALDKLHKKYVEMKFAKKAPKPPKMRHHRRDVTESRRRVFDEIARLQKKGLSIDKALHSMRIKGTYNTYLGKITNATWKRYYIGRKR